MGRKILVVVDDHSALIRKIIKQLSEEHTYYINSSSNDYLLGSNHTPEREHGWYRKFEKRNKKSNLTD